MGLFDQVVGALAGNQGGGNNALLEAVLHLVNNPRTGGLAGLVNSFEEGGLGSVVGSWIATGQNLPVSAEQVQSVLGGPLLQGLAQQFGISHEQIAGGLASILPQVVDHLTPNGQLPQEGAQGNELLAQGFDLLKGKLFG